MAIRLAALLAILIGCAHAPLPSPTAERRAVEVAWLATAGTPALAPWPRVTIAWSRGCVERPSQPGSCVDGYNLASAAVCEVHLRWADAFWASRFAHELIHCIQAAQGHPDPDHLRTADWDREPDMEQALWRAGL